MHPVHSAGRAREGIEKHHNHSASFIVYSSLQPVSCVSAAAALQMLVQLYSSSAVKHPAFSTYTISLSWLFDKQIWGIHAPAVLQAQTKKKHLHSNRFSELILKMEKLFWLRTLNQSRGEWNLSSWRHVKYKSSIASVLKEPLTALRCGSLLRAWDSTYSPHLTQHPFPQLPAQLPAHSTQVKTHLSFLSRTCCWCPSGFSHWSLPPLVGTFGCWIYCLL